MWIFTKYGFFSAVCARYQKGKQKDQPDPKNLMIRARVRQHLQNLLDLFPHIFKGKISESTGTDYAYRLFVKKTVWVDFLVDLGDGIDYDNFKDECHHQPAEILDPAYVHSLMTVWSTMHQLQPTREKYYRRDPLTRPTGNVNTEHSMFQPLPLPLPLGLPSTMGELRGSPFDEEDEFGVDTIDPLDPWGELEDPSF